MGGTATLGAFAGALVGHCLDVDALAALTDALAVTKPNIDRRIAVLGDIIPTEGELRPGEKLEEALWRTVIESMALIAGFLLGGVVGVGTVAYALLIGPGVQAAVQRLRGRTAAG